MTLPVIVQIVGALLVLLGFVLAQLRIFDQRSFGYLVTNAVGSVALGATALFSHDWGFVLLEAVWASVSLASLGRRGRGPSEAVANR